MGIKKRNTKINNKINPDFQKTSVGKISKENLIFTEKVMLGF